MPTGLPAGTPLVETVRTPPGTLLVGRVFPTEFGAIAVLLVTGDPLVAWADLVNQAAAAGFVFVPASGADPCWVSHAQDGWWYKPDDPDARRPTAGVSGLGCGVYGWARPNAEGRRRHLDLQMWIGAAAQPYLAHLVVRYFARPDDPGRTDIDGSRVQVPVVASSSPVRPRSFGRLPGVGARIGAPFFDEGYRVASGSGLLAPVAPGACAAGGFLAVLRTTGPTVDVVESYAAQFRKGGLRTEERPEVHAGPVPATLVRLSSAGGGDATIIATGPDRAGFLVIDRCND
jgi:hypothetical protein